MSAAPLMLSVTSFSTTPTSNWYCPVASCILHSITAEPEGRASWRPPTQKDRRSVSPTSRPVWNSCSPAGQHDGASRLRELAGQMGSTRPAGKVRGRTQAHQFPKTSLPLSCPAAGRPSPLHSRRDVSRVLVDIARLKGSAFRGGGSASRSRTLQHTVAQPTPGRHTLLDM